MGKLASFVSAGIGLAVEAIQAQCEDQHPPSQGNRGYTGYTYNPSLVQQSRMGYAPYPHPQNAQNAQNPQNARNAPVQRSLASDAPPTYEESERCDQNGYKASSQPSASSSRRAPAHPRPPRLTCPIIIPQRRPEDMKRGFMLAYPPVLQNYGIDQDTFLRFLTDFNASSKSSRCFDAINLAAFGVGFVPDMTAFVVSTAVPIALHYAKKAQRGFQTETFLTRMNREFFLPRGLFAVVMIWRPDQASAQVTIDSTSGETRIIPTPLAPVRRGGIAGFFGRKKLPEQEFILPQTAPLVFLSERDVPHIKPEGGTMERMAHFTADYFDRRAQAKYAAEHPNSSLAMQGVSFRNRWADPNNPANSSTLLTMLSGGMLGTVEEPKKKKKKKYVPPEKRGRMGRLKAEFLEQDLLYLMISNRPTEQEMIKTEQFLSNQHMQ